MISALCASDIATLLQLRNNKWYRLWRWYHCVMISRKHDTFNSCRGRTKLLFRVYLLTECAYSECEPQGDDRSLERHCGQGNRPMSFRGVKRRGNPLNRNENTFGDWQTPHLFSQSLPRREFALSVRARTRTPATVAPNYLLGESRAGHPHPIRMNGGVGATRKATHPVNVL